ncbi:MAG: hypothetical protein KDD45_17320, partial [Bdellovibrionales bacterium]|nr:hypothetical protein [Bdellovibrionales bacterium]
HYLEQIRKSCLIIAKNDGIELSDNDKKLIMDKFENKIKDFIDLAQQNPQNINKLYSNGQLDLDKFTCLQFQEVNLLQQITCQKNGRSEFALTSATQRQQNAAQASLEANREGAPDLGNPVIINEGPGVSEPIPVKATLAKIDSMIQNEGGGKITPEIATKAGQLFNESVYEPVQRTINSIDKKVFTAEGIKASSNSSRGLYEIGKRSPASKNKLSEAGGDTKIKGYRVPSKNSSLEDPSIFINESGEPGSNGFSKNGSTDQKANTTNPQRNLGVGANSYSAANLGGGQGAETVVPANRNSGLQGNSQPVELPPLNNEQKQNLNVFVRDLQIVDNVEDLRSMLITEGNAPQVDYLVKEQLAGGDSEQRAPASSSTVLMDKLKEFNVKLYDERSGQTLYTPSQKPEYIVRVGANGIKFLKIMTGRRR